MLSAVMRKRRPADLKHMVDLVLFSDRSMIDRIFQNLLTNAIRYSAGTIKISLSQTEKNGIVFCIENTVQDMEALDAERMFERFYTGDKSRHT